MEVNNLDNTQEEKINLKEVILPYVYRWKWFVFSIIISLSFAFIYLYITKPKYDVTAKVLVKDDEKSGITSELSAFADLGSMMGGSISKIENEIEILKSRTIISQVASDLNLNVSFYDVSNFIKKEIYLDKIYTINFLDRNSLSYFKEGNFLITPKNNNQFEFKNLKSKSIEIHKFGNTFDSKFGEIIIFPNNIKNIIPIEIHIKKLDKLIDALQKEIIIAPVNKESSAIQLSITIENIDKGKAILNTLIDKHTKSTVEDKNQVSKNTLNFINERLSFITDELSTVEQNVSTFKSSNKIFDLTANASIFLENESENEKILIENKTQLKLAEYIIDYINNHKKGDLLPSNMGITNHSVEKMIETINILQLERNKLIDYSSDRNPIIINLDNQIENLKRSLKESLLNQLKSLKIQNNELEQQNNLLENKLSEAPKQEKDFKEIYRQQQIKESLYLYLLQKREETAISLAVTVPNTKIIDEAYSNGETNSPKKRMIIIISLLIGVGITLSIIYIIKLLDTKLKNKQDILDLGLPLIGDIPLSKNKEKLIVKQLDRSSVTEAFRLLRTNINFLSANSESKTIFITSTISKEGKSFTALNLSVAFGRSDKKVLLIGLDLRAPKLLDYLELGNKEGVSDYIVNSKIEWKNLILKINDAQKVDFLPSGTIPPNPAELLMSDRLAELFKEVKNNYDYIIVDTAPVGMVADTLLMNKFADILIYVARMNFLDKRLLNIPQSLYKENKFKNMTILLNGSDSENGYGYGYGYGYGDITTKKTLIQRIFKKDE